MKAINQVEPAWLSAAVSISEQDRAEFPYHTDGAIIGIKTVRAIPDDVLLALPDSAEEIERLRVHLGNNTNPRWVLGRVAEELYGRGLIDETRFDELNRRAG